jgi:colanic acid biosynthesis glycosyl transferase WcaI
LRHGSWSAASASPLEDGGLVRNMSDSINVLVHDYTGHHFQVALSRELAQRGHKVVHAFAGNLLTPRGTLARTPDDPATLSFAEVRMDPNYRRDKYRFFRRRPMELAYGHELASLIRHESPDLVISGNTPTEPQWAAVRACQRASIAFVSWVQDFYGIAVDKLVRRKLPVLGHLIGGYYRWLDRRVLRRSSGVVCITDDFVPIVTAAGVPRSKIVTIPNWASLEELPMRPRANPWSLKHGLDRCFCFLYTGTLALKHNPDLLRQLSRTFADQHEVRVVVVSEGPVAEWLAERKREEGLNNLVLIPFQDFNDMPEVMASGDVLVAVLEPDAGVFSVPSKVLSYHCAGRAILASIPPQNLAARMIEKTGSGICVAPDRTSDFLGAAETLYRDEPRRSACGSAARRHAEEHFDIEKITDRFETFFQECLARRTSCSNS